MTGEKRHIQKKNPNQDLPNPSYQSLLLAVRKIKNYQQISRKKEEQEQLWI